MFNGPILHSRSSFKRETCFTPQASILTEKQKAIIATTVLAILTLTGWYLQHKAKNDIKNFSTLKIDISLQGFEL